MLGFSSTNHRDCGSSRVPFLALLTAGALLLTGCLGGGGGDNNGGGGIVPGIVPTALVAVTPENAEDISGEVLGATEAVSGTDDFGSVFVSGAVFDASPRTVSLSELARRLISELADPNIQALAIPSVTGAVVTTTVPCDTGSYTTTTEGIDAGSALPSNASVTIVYSDCRYALDGLVLNGSVSVRDLTFDGDFTRPDSGWSFSATFDFQDLQAGGLASSEVINGTFSIDMSMSAELVVSTVITGERLTVTENGVEVTVRNYSFSFVEDEATGALVITMDGEVESVTLGGRVLFETVVSLEATGSADPYTGSLKITGADGTSVTIIALDSVNARLEVDFDGDGTVDQTIDTTWSAMDS